jgi:hypothetical protein
MSTAGPAACTPTPEPRNRPAPIALPRPIMISWRGLSAWPSWVVDGSGAMGLAGIGAVNAERADTITRQ